MNRTALLETAIIVLVGFGFMGVFVATGVLLLSMALVEPPLSTALQLLEIQRLLVCYGIVGFCVGIWFITKHIMITPPWRKK